MAVWYVDPEGGNDANTGTSFAQRWKTLMQASNANGVNAGDTIRIIGSSAPTSLSQSAKWTGMGAVYEATSAAYTVQQVSTASNATPIEITTSATHSYQTGDVVAVDGVGGNTAANGVWIITYVSSTKFTLDGSVGNGAFTSGGSVYYLTPRCVVLTSALTKNIACVGGPQRRSAWTANANVTSTYDTPTSCSVFHGAGQETIAVGASFTTGQAAYWNLPSATDFSGYQGVCFWFRQTVGSSSIVAGDMALVLCTGTNGSGETHTIPILAVGLDWVAYAGFGATDSGWIPVVWQNGSNLNSSIQSIALKILTDRGAVTVQLANIVAIKAPGATCISNGTLIGKNTGWPELWWPIRSIDDKLVMLDVQPNWDQITSSEGGNYVGYNGTTESVTTHIRNMVNAREGALSFEAGGSAGSHVVYSGGWNRTDMSTQTLESWLDIGFAYTGAGSSFSNNYITLDKLRVCRSRGLGLLYHPDDTGLPYAGTVTINNDFHTVGVSAINPPVNGGALGISLMYIDSLTFGNLSACCLASTDQTTPSSWYAIGMQQPAVNLAVDGAISGTDIVVAATATGVGLQMQGRVSLGAASISAVGLPIFAEGAPAGVAEGCRLSLWQGTSITSVTVRDNPMASKPTVINGNVGPTGFGTATIGTLTVKYNSQFTGASGPNIGAGITVGTLTSDHNRYGLSITAMTNDSYVGGGTIGNNTTAGVLFDNALQYFVDTGQSASMVFRNVTISDATEVSWDTSVSLGTYLYSQNHDGTTDNHKIFLQGGTITAQTSVRHTASGLAWQMQPTSSARDSSCPVTLHLATVAVNANALVTVKAWMRRSNTGLTMKLVCKGGQINGVSSDQSASMTASADTWEQLTITFTPTEKGAVQIIAHAYGGTTYSGYVDDVTVTQA